MKLTTSRWPRKHETTKLIGKFPAFVANRAGPRYTQTLRLRCIEVEELRHRVQFFLQHHHPLLVDDVANLAVGVEQVAELARADGADLDAGGVAAGARPLN